MEDGHKQKQKWRPMYQVSNAIIQIAEHQRQWDYSLKDKVYQITAIVDDDDHDDIAIIELCSTRGYWKWTEKHIKEKPQKKNIRRESWISNQFSFSFICMKNGKKKLSQP